MNLFGIHSTTKVSIFWPKPAFEDFIFSFSFIEGTVIWHKNSTFKGRLRCPLPWRRTTQQIHEIAFSGCFEMMPITRKCQCNSRTSDDIHQPKRVISIMFNNYKNVNQKPALLLWPIISDEIHYLHATSRLIDLETTPCNSWLEAWHMYSAPWSILLATNVILLCVMKPPLSEASI